MTVPQMILFALILWVLVGVGVALALGPVLNRRHSDSTPADTEDD